MNNKYTVIVTDDGAIRRCSGDKVHCDNGPAVQYLNGYKVWFRLWQRNNKKVSFYDIK